MEPQRRVCPIGDPVVMEWKRCPGVGVCVEGSWTVRIRQNEQRWLEGRGGHCVHHGRCYGYLRGHHCGNDQQDQDDVVRNVEMS